MTDFSSLKQEEFIDQRYLTFLNLLTMKNVTNEKNGSSLNGEFYRQQFFWAIKFSQAKSSIGLRLKPGVTTVQAKNFPRVSVPVQKNSLK